MTVIDNLYWRTFGPRHTCRMATGMPEVVAGLCHTVGFDQAAPEQEGPIHDIHSLRTTVACRDWRGCSGTRACRSAGFAQVKIGFQAPLTGPAATDGVSAKVAAELAIERINATGGILGQKAELVMYDDQAKTEEAVFTANKLVGQDGVKFAVSGSYSASGRAAAPIFQNAKMPFISAYGVHPDITRAGEYAFRTVHLGQPQGRAGAKFIGGNLKHKNISVISMDNDYGQATLEGFKAPSASSV